MILDEARRSRWHLFALLELVHDEVVALLLRSRLVLVFVVVRVASHVILPLTAKQEMLLNILQLRRDVIELPFGPSASSFVQLRVDIAIIPYKPASSASLTHARVGNDSKAHVLDIAFDAQSVSAEVARLRTRRLRVVEASRDRPVATPGGGSTD